MTRECAWCRECLGQVAPLEDSRLTHGICAACGRRLLLAAGIHDLPPPFALLNQGEAGACGETKRVG
jgi:hypothetical protein